MEDRIHVADIDRGRRESVGGQPLAELLRALFVGAMRDADKEVRASLADVPSVEGTGRCDLMNRSVEAIYCLPNARNFANPRSGAGTSEDGRTAGQNRRVLDESRIRMLQVDGEADQAGAAHLKSVAISFML